MHAMTEDDMEKMIEVKNEFWLEFSGLVWRYRNLAPVQFRGAYDDVLSESTSFYGISDGPNEQVVSAVAKAIDVACLAAHVNMHKTMNAPINLRVSSSIALARILTGHSQIRGECDMNEATLKAQVPDEALEGAILKWQKIVDGVEEDHGGRNCPLCQKYKTSPNGCGKCPVAVDTGEDYCAGTPYRAWADSFSFLLDKRWIANTPERKALAQAELDYLKSLRA